MKRILMVLTVALVMVAMVVATAMPALAAIKMRWVNSRIAEVVMGQDRQRASTYRGVLWAACASTRKLRPWWASRAGRSLAV
jgi:hypothetical protein